MVTKSGEERILKALFGEPVDLVLTKRSPKHTKLSITQIFVNESKKIVTVLFNNNDKQVIKCCDGDNFDATIGVALAVLYHTFGSKTQARKQLGLLTKTIQKMPKESKNKIKGKKVQ